MKTFTVLSFTALVALSTGCSRDKGNDVGRATRSAQALSPRCATDMATKDAQDFLQHVASVNAVEIDLGKLAAERGTVDDVKNFARMMIHDHTAAGEKLTTLASDLRVEAQRQLEQPRLPHGQKLATLSGADLNREYASAMVDDHKELIDQLEPRIDKKTLDEWTREMEGQTSVAAESVAILPDKSENPTTMRVNQFAADIYPTVHAHLKPPERSRARSRSVDGRAVTCLTIYRSILFFTTLYPTQGAPYALRNLRRPRRCERMVERLI